MNLLKLFGKFFFEGLWLVLNNQKLRESKAGLNELLDIRFLLLTMGFFGFYAGLIYNDFLSMPLNLFGSCFKPIEGTHYTETKDDCVYPLGIEELST
jgi:V-type H+-transporting ATPase subunit a